MVDEAYIDFCKNASLLPELEKHPNLIILQTLSKAWGAANIRLGMAYASSKIISYFNKVKPPYNINGVTQKIALDALKNFKQQNDWTEEIITEKKILIQALKELSFIERIYHSDANFILIKVNNANKLYQFLADKKIIIRNRSTTENCDNCVRITIGTNAENSSLIGALKIYK